MKGERSSTEGNGGGVVGLTGGVGAGVRGSAAIHRQGDAEDDDMCR